MVVMVIIVIIIIIIIITITIIIIIMMMMMMMMMMVWTTKTLLKIYLTSVLFYRILKRVTIWSLCSKAEYLDNRSLHKNELQSRCLYNHPHRTEGEAGYTSAFVTVYHPHRICCNGCMRSSCSKRHSLKF